MNKKIIYALVVVASVIGFGIMVVLSNLAQIWTQ